MTGYYSVQRIRDAEEATGLLSSGVLMARAANGVAQTVLAELRERCGEVYGRRVGLVIGAGNNGGDALYAGAILAGRGVDCQALLLSPDKTHTEGLTAYRKAGGRVVDELSGDLDVVLDAVVGLGGSGPLRPNAAEVFAAVDAPVVAVDLPSGIDPDTGVVNDPHVRADVSVTFGEPRLAHLLTAPECGRVDVIDIGLDLSEPDVESLSDGRVGGLWPVPGPHDDKYTQGVVGIVAGSGVYPGAALLCTQAAVAATSGMTRYVGPAAHDVVNHRPEVVAAEHLDDAGRAQAWWSAPASAPTRGRTISSSRSWRPTSPCWWTPTASPFWPRVPLYCAGARHPRSSHRTRASSRASPVTRWATTASPRSGVWPSN